PLHNSPMVENDRIGYNGVDRAFTACPLRLPHSIANDLSPSKLHFFAIGRKILFHLNHEVSIGKAQSVAHSWPEHLRVGASTHPPRHSQTPLFPVIIPTPRPAAHPLLPAGTRRRASRRRRARVISCEIVPARIALPCPQVYRGDTQAQPFDQTTRLY